MAKDATIRNSHRQRKSRRSSWPRLRRETVLALSLLVMLVGFVCYHVWRYGW